MSYFFMREYDCGKLFRQNFIKKQTLILITLI